jgi:hypothetical protein
MRVWFTGRASSTQSYLIQLNHGHIQILVDAGLDLTALAIPTMHTHTTQTRTQTQCHNAAANTQHAAEAKIGAKTRENGTKRKKPSGDTSTNDIDDEKMMNISTVKRLKTESVSSSEVASSASSSGGATKHKHTETDTDTEREKHDFDKDMTGIDEESSDILSDKLSAMATMLASSLTSEHVTELDDWDGSRVKELSDTNGRVFLTCANLALLDMSSIDVILVCVFS